MSTKDHINSIIKETFDVIQNVYDKQREVGGEKNNSPESRIIFPKKRGDKIRISEQELRFIFVEQLNKYIRDNKWNVFYSVETPTLGRYSFKGKEPIVDEINGQSASFDLVIHDNDYKRIALIEFKANNSDEYEHKKDFLKLSYPEKEGKENDVFFIEIVDGATSETFRSLSNKASSHKDIFRCYSLKLRREITDDIRNCK